MHIVNTILTFGVITFLIYTPYFVLSLVKAVKAWGNYKMTSQWVSELGISNKKSSPIFNARLSIFALLSVFSSLSLFNILPKSNISLLFILLLLLIAIATFYVGIFPMDTKPDEHLLSSGVTWGIILLDSVFSLFMVLNGVLPVILGVINVATIIVMPLYIFSVKYCESNDLKVGIHNYLVCHKGVWEWGVLSLSLFWNFCTAIFILIETEVIKIIV